jgi:hypothetical protein
MNVYLVDLLDIGSMHCGDERGRRLWYLAESERGTTLYCSWQSTSCLLCIYKLHLMYMYINNSFFIESSLGLV